jgi:hypothetical protein
MFEYESSSSLYVRVQSSSSLHIRVRVEFKLECIEFKQFGFGPCLISSNVALKGSLYIAGYDKAKNDET